MRLPFDAHNHIHMGPSPPSAAIGNAESIGLSGIALMSTHPRDFSVVADLVNETTKSIPGVKIVPCFGVHPWFLHELTDADWETFSSDDDHDQDDMPIWIKDLQEAVEANPGSIVGEIGLDAFHFHPDTGALTTPLDVQVEAFEAQMKVAARLQRPVSIHEVQCFGSLMKSLSKLQKSRFGLPPTIYFHAFGGKVGTVDQLSALCGRKEGQIYFGFAPIVNFRSPKTAAVIRKVGLERLVLETDHEDAARVPESIKLGIAYVAEALGVSKESVIKKTTDNAFSLYGLQDT